MLPVHLKLWLGKLLKLATCEYEMSYDVLQNKTQSILTQIFTHYTRSLHQARQESDTFCVLNIAQWSISAPWAATELRMGSSLLKPLMHWGCRLCATWILPPWNTVLFWRILLSSKPWHTHYRTKIDRPIDNGSKAHCFQTRSGVISRVKNWA